MRAPRVVGEDGKMLGCEMEDTCPWPATGIQVVEGQERRFCEFHNPLGIGVHILESPDG
jgi:hypothetical protein